MEPDEVYTVKGYADPSLDDFFEAQRSVSAAQRERLRAYIETTQPELVLAYEREARAFSQITDTVLEPTLRLFADNAKTQGWHMRVVRESDTDGIFGLATPGIRLLVARNPLPDPKAIAVFSQISFIGFHGRCPHHAVEMTRELHRDGPSTGVERDERVLEYDALNQDEVRNCIVETLRRLSSLT